MTMDAYRDRMDDIFKLAEQFYTRLDGSNVVLGDTTEPTTFACGVPIITEEEIGKALNDMKSEELQARTA